MDGRREGFLTDTYINKRAVTRRRKERPFRPPGAAQKEIRIC